MIRWIGFEERFREKYVAFARECYGSTAYQASEKYLTWLYETNPTPGGGWRDFLIGVSDDVEVVGCLHKMRLPWCIDAEVVSVPALHNLFVKPAYRKGIDWLVAALAGERHAYVPGSAGALARFYHGLGFQPIPTEWYCKSIRPLSGFMRLALHRVLGQEVKGRLPFLDFGWCRGGTTFHVTTVPCSETLCAIAGLWNRAADGRVAPRWTGELLAWRFFHPRGPRHVLIHDGTADQPTCFLLFSVGPRRKLLVARLLGMYGASHAATSALLRCAKHVIRRCGAHVIIAPLADSRLTQQLRLCGWRGKHDRIQSFFYHQSGKTFSDFCLTGAAGDHGFEAIELSSSPPA